MPRYDLDENLTHIVSLMATGLLGKSVEPIWEVAEGNDDIVGIFGASPEITQEINAGRFGIAELAMLEDAGFLNRTGRASYTLRRQQILDAYRTNFEDAIEVELEQAQKDLLCKLAEAARNLPHSKREQFLFVQAGAGASVQHPGLEGGGIDAYVGDIEILGHENLLALSHRSHASIVFDVTPRGFKYYEQLKRSLGQPIQRLEGAVKSYLDTAPFSHKYPEEYRKWLRAEELLWGADSEEKLTTIGHLCREAIQDFTTILVDQYHPPHVSPNPIDTIARMRSVFEVCNARLGSTEKPFLDALLTYWVMLTKLAARQEHGAHKEGESLVWEDGRRLVFHTAVVMYEIDKALSRAS